MKKINFKLSIVISLFFFLSLGIFQPSGANASSLVPGVNVPLGYHQVVPQGQIFATNTVDQSFVASSNGLTQVRFIIATYSRKNTSNLKVKITEGEFTVFATSVNSAKLRDNQSYIATFSKIVNSHNKLFHIFLSSSDAKPGNAVTVYLRKDGPYKQGHLLLSGVSSKMSLVFSTFYE